jgi:hypothetical protein
MQNGEAVIYQEQTRVTSGVRRSGHEIASCQGPVFPCPCFRTALRKEDSKSSSFRPCLYMTNALRRPSSLSWHQRLGGSRGFEKPGRFVLALGVRAQETYRTPRSIEYNFMTAKYMSKRFQMVFDGMRLTCVATKTSEKHRAQEETHYPGAFISRRMSHNR